MRPLRMVLGLAAAAAVFGAGLAAVYNASAHQSLRLGPAWFQAISFAGGPAMLMAGLVLAIGAVLAGIRRDASAGPRGLPLGWTALAAGILALALGLLVPAVLFAGIVRTAYRGLMPWLVTIEVYGIPLMLVALGVVLIGESILTLRDKHSEPGRSLTLGQGTFETGLVLLVVSAVAFPLLSGIDRAGLGFLGFVYLVQGIPAGLTLIALGGLIRWAEGPRSSPDGWRQDEGHPSPAALQHGSAAAPARPMP
jgi:hypothetical protein